MKVNLTTKGGFSWGNTSVRIKVKEIELIKTEVGYTVDMTYSKRLYDEFTDPLDMKNIIKKSIDLPFSMPYIMKTDYTNRKIEIKVKNLKDIPKELRNKEKELGK